LKLTSFSPNSFPQSSLSILDLCCPSGKLREPELFTGKDPKKLNTFIFQCQLYFWNLDFDNNSKRVTFALSYLQDVAQEWFEPGISRLTNEPPEWFDNWEAFLDELCTNFGPYNKTGDANMN
jgi:hypothetical protein